MTCRYRPADRGRASLSRWRCDVLFITCDQVTLQPAVGAVAEDIEAVRAVRQAACTAAASSRRRTRGIAHLLHHGEVALSELRVLIVGQERAAVRDDLIQRHRIKGF